MEQVSFNLNLSAQALALIPIVAALLQMLKVVPALEKLKQYFPFIALGVSYGLALLLKVPDPVLAALVIGLSAGGGYDLVRMPTKLGSSNTEATTPK